MKRPLYDQKSYTYATQACNRCKLKTNFLSNWAMRAAFPALVFWHKGSPLFDIESFMLHFARNVTSSELNCINHYGFYATSKSDFFPSNFTASFRNVIHLSMYFILINYSHLKSVKCLMLMQRVLKGGGNSQSKS